MKYGGRIIAVILLLISASCGSDKVELTQRATVESAGYSVSFPGEWTMDENSKKGSSVKYTVIAPEGPVCHLYYFPVEKGQKGNEEYMKLFKKGYKERYIKHYENAHYLEDKDVKIGSQRARRLVLKGDVSASEIPDQERPIPMKIMLHIYSVDNEPAVLQCMSQVKRYDKYKKTFTKIAESFQIE